MEIPADELSSLGDARSRLASGDQAGGTPLGNRIRDLETKFRIVVGPVDWPSFLNFLPSRDGFNKLNAMAHLFVRDWLTFDVNLFLQAAECAHLRVVLDGETSQLGFTTGLFEKHGAEQDLGLVLDPGDVECEAGVSV